MTCSYCFQILFSEGPTSPHPPDNFASGKWQWQTSVYNNNINDNNNNNDNDNNKYISRALNSCVSNQPEAQRAVHVQRKPSKLHVQLKPSKQRNQRCQQTNKKQKQKNKKKKKKSRGWAGKGARAKYQVNN